MDDPRAILKAAGVECPEVDAWDEWSGEYAWDEDIAPWAVAEQAGHALLALAQIVAEQKAELDWWRTTIGSATGYIWLANGEYVDDVSVLAQLYDEQRTP